MSIYRTPYATYTNINVLSEAQANELTANFNMLAAMLRGEYTSFSYPKFAHMPGDIRDKLLSEMTSLVVTMGGGGTGDPGGGESELPPLIYETEASVLFAAMIVAGDTPSLQRQLTLNRMYKRLKAQSTLWAKLIANPLTSGLWVIGNTEASWMINKLSPGTRNLTKVGAPVFTANDRVTSTSNTAYYDTGIIGSALDQNSACLLVYHTNAGVAGTGVDAGITDGTNGLTVNSMSTGSVLSARCMGATVNAGNTLNWGGRNAIGVSRTASDTYKMFHNGLAQEVATQASAPIASALTCRILGAAGSSARSLNAIGAVLICPGLTDAEYEQAHAIIRSTVDAIRCGEPVYQDVGYGDSAIDANVIIYGATSAGICAAIEAKRQGLSVALVADYLENSLQQIGGMAANGLGYLDIGGTALASVSGVFRTLITQANAFTSNPNTQTAGDMSVWTPYFNFACRRALDPARTGGSIAGSDIKLYFTGGVASIAQSAGRITSLTTVDGRTFTGDVFIGCDYDGDILPLISGITTISGMDAHGTAPGEDLAGWREGPVNRMTNDSGGGPYNLDPYVTPGVSGSGLIAGLVADPGFTTGAADPLIQGWNFRLAASTNLGNMAPWTATLTLAEPPNYSAATYERFGRLFAAYTADAYTAITADIFNNRQVTNSGRDCNNGTSRMGTDFNASAYQNAADYTARKAAIKDLEYKTKGLFYWLLASGDSRIHASFITDTLAIGLDARAFLDPAEGDSLYWPGLPYRRDPLFRLKNTTWYWTGHDTYDLTGAPRNDRTITNGGYDNDHHANRLIPNDFSGSMFIASIGGMSDNASSKHAPIPVDIFMTDAGVCSNFLTATAPSCSQMVWDELRMEYSLSLAAQGLSIWAALAIEGGIAVQAVDYTTFRTRFLAVPDLVTPVIPQVNAA